MQYIAIATITIMPVIQYSCVATVTNTITACTHTYACTYYNYYWGAGSHNAGGNTAIRHGQFFFLLLHSMTSAFYYSKVHVQLYILNIPDLYNYE